MSGNLNIKEQNIICNTLRCNKIFGSLQTDGTNQDVDLSGGTFKVTGNGFLLADQEIANSNKLIKLSNGDLIISDEDGSNPEIILDTSNQQSSITKCDHLEISPDSGGYQLLYIKDVNGNTEDIVNIQTDSSTDPVFKISSSGQTSITDIVLNTVDINGGTIDNTVIGGTTPVAGNFTTITASTSLDVTGSTGIILENDETITNSTDGTVLISGDVASGTHTFKSNGDNDLILKTGNTTTGSITITDGADGNIAITPNGTGEVDISKVDIDSGTIDNTIIGGTTPANASFNKLFIKTKVITTANLTSESNLLHDNYPNSVFYFNLDNSNEDTGSIGNGTDGQVIHMFYDNTESNGSLKIDFGLNNLRCGSGESQYITFNSKGQSASLVFIGNSINKWCIINTGAVIE